MREKAALIVFIVAVVGIGLVIGLTNIPGDWYASLNKPSFNPPNWIFGPVWTVLYVLIAIAGWQCWTQSRHGTAMKVWFVQMILNFLWSPVFFGAHLPTAALVVIALLLVAIVAFIALAWRRIHIAALLFLPYAAWVAFATLLNASIVALN